MHLPAALLCAAVAGLVGWFVPLLIARLPEPVSTREGDGEADTPAAANEQDEGPKEPYADIAAIPGLAWKAALASAVAGAVMGATLGWQWALVILTPLAPVGVALAVVDWRTKLLPSRIVLPATGGALVLAAAGWAVTGDPDDLVRAAIALVVVRSIFWVLWWFHATGMGFGDVRLAALIGVALGHLGWAEVVTGVYAGFLVFGLPGLLLAIIRRDRSLLKAPFPFGPAMLVGALLGIVLGPWVAAHLAPGLA